jgi:DNA repair exonuclease SbcCD ATPase subunit
MRLHLLKVTNFAGIGEADIAFGPGLNVLFGSNDLGKSTLADAIRLALLLPYGSADSEPYSPWGGRGDPVVELTFSTDVQRFWRVRKEFGKAGSAVLEESKNGRDFDEVERARKVDARLREILCWGLPELGGTGSGKGLPDSFLATVLLSTQSNVTAVLGTSLQNDRTGTGKERIAGALQAVAQDPLFLALLRETQARWDEAFTEKGKKSTAKNSVFKTAAERLKEAREEKERLQRLVDESEGVEHQLRDLVLLRAAREEAHLRAAGQLAEVEAIAAQAAAYFAASERVRKTTETVRRIKKLTEDGLTSERLLQELIAKQKLAETQRDAARATAEAAAEALKAAEQQAQSEEADAEMADKVARHQRELRRATAERAVTEAEATIAAVGTVQKLVDEAAASDRELQEHTRVVDRARERSSELADKLNAAEEPLARCETLELGLVARMADALVASRRAEADKKADLQQTLSRVLEELGLLATERKKSVLPEATHLFPMRKLATDLAAARGALDVGLMVTVAPSQPPLDVKIERDGSAPAQLAIGAPLEIEANVKLDVTIGDIVSVQVRGGRRDALERARGLEDRWVSEVVPWLAAAGAQDLEALDAKVREAGQLDARIAALSQEVESLQSQLNGLADVDEALREAITRAIEARVGLDQDSIETLAPELDTLGTDPGAALRLRRQQAFADRERARTEANNASTTFALAEERARALQERSRAATTARDVALEAFPSGLAAATESAQAVLQSSEAELRNIAQDLESLDTAKEARSQRLAEAIREARDAAEKASAALEKAEGERTAALTEQAAENGRLQQLRKQMIAEDLGAEESALRADEDALAELAPATRGLTLNELEETRTKAGRAKRELDETDREIQRTQGALEQVGGAVARERLNDAIEAFEHAERYERELEADYEAWKLLLEQMRAADAAQASNLGEALAPAIASQFQALTAQRYHGIRLTAQLGTEGVLVDGNVRSHDRISVGTREQLSTLYRLSLGEYLRTTIVLDDQLVQSDGARMDWFRALLASKARSFQIVVFTCRPDDYLAASAMPNGGVTLADTEDGYVRAVDLGRAVRRR